jgi:microcystin-dependent protein
MAGAMIAFVPHTTNGATVTLNVDGLGDKPLRSAPSTELLPGTIIQGTPYAAVYNNSDGVFYLKGYYGSGISVPVGALLPWITTSPAVPNSSFVNPTGQALSRTTYSVLFGLIGTFYGSGDGSSTFNVPNLNGRMIACLDGMNGSTATNLITNAGSGIVGTAIGQTGGAETHTLTKAEIPTGLFTLNFSDPQHSHTVTYGNDANGFGTHPTANSQTTTVGAQSTSSASTGITASLTDNAGGGAHASMPPTIILPYIMRVI